MAIQYRIDSENYICGYQRWNSERDKDNEEYQNFISSIKNNPEPIEEMNNAIGNRTGRLFNNETKHYYRLVNNNIICVNGVDEIQDFEEKYPYRKIIELLIKGIDNNNNSDFITFKNDFLNIVNIRRSR